MRNDERVEDHTASTRFLVNLKTEFSLFYLS
jgi:hypothetical protein